MLYWLLPLHALLLPHLLHLCKLRKLALQLLQWTYSSAGSSSSSVPIFRWLAAASICCSISS
jgi:hypothetical protein